LSRFTKLTVLSAILLLGGAAGAAEPQAGIVELESPLAAAPPLQGYLRAPAGSGPSPAVVLLHGCNGHAKQLDGRWGKRIAAWHYVTLTVDSFGPRGIRETCDSGAPMALAFDAYRALNFLVQQPVVDPARVAVLGFSQGGWLALSSVEHGAIEQSSQHKFRAAIAFYPPRQDFKDDMTVPTLILVGALDDVTPASDCRSLVEGRDGYGISRQKGAGAPVKLVVYPGAYHAFDVPFQRPIAYFGHHFEYNQTATDQSSEALHQFLLATLGGQDQINAKPDR
jgi:dienelactone hydrolase